MVGGWEARLDLIFDADDTLWDSNIHFLEAFDAFAAAVVRAGIEVERAEIQAVVHRSELDLIPIHGYGRRPYVMALRLAADRLAPSAIRKSLDSEIDAIGNDLVERHSELLPGVEPTVRELSTRHRLMIFTKGRRDEQMRKLRRSGLGRYFKRMETPHEKDVHAYRRLIRDAELDPTASFMIGNSPRSDINPAVRAGLGAVFIPYPHTWELEQEEIAPHERIIEITAFRDLVDIF
jgi:putative hydrolase of the HAD superfamily